MNIWNSEENYAFHSMRFKEYYIYHLWIFYSSHVFIMTRSIIIVHRYVSLCIIYAFLCISRIMSFLWYLFLFLIPLSFLYQDVSWRYIIMYESVALCILISLYIYKPHHVFLMMFIYIYYIAIIFMSIRIMKMHHYLSLCMNMYQYVSLCIITYHLCTLC